MPERPIGVLIVDDHAVVRRGLRELISTTTEFEAVGEAGDGAEALLMVRTLHPDIVLMDISMPIVDGVEATRSIMEDSPDTRVIMLTSDASEARVLSALEAGAVAYMLKETEPDLMLMRLRSTARTIPRLLHRSTRGEASAG